VLVDQYIRQLIVFYHSRIKKSNVTIFCGKKLTQTTKIKGRLLEKNLKKK